MDFRTLLDRVDTIESNQPSIKKYLSENLYNTPEMQPHWKRIDEGFIKGYEKYLSEVALTADQIQNIFKQAGGAEGEAPKDPGKLAALVDKVLPASQAANLEKSLPEPDAGPVQGFEQKAAAAVQNLGVDSGTKQSLMQMVKAGIKKPETQQLILAAVGAGLGSLISKIGPILSMIPGGGPVASAITGAVVAGGVAVLSAKLRGEDWKTAFKGAIKPALMGGAAAVVGNLATSAVGAMMGGSNTSDQAQPPGAGVGIGDTMPDGSKVTGLEGGQVTVTRPDGTTETMSNTDYYGRTGQQGISDPNAAPADSDKPKRQMPQWAQDLQNKKQLINDFAQQMGLPPGNHDVQMQGGVPVSIDGQPVPQNLYSPDQQRNIQAAQQMSAMMNGSSANQASSNAPQGKDDYSWVNDNGSKDAPSAANNFGKNQEEPAKIVPRIPPGASLSDFSNTNGSSNAPIGQNFDAGIAPLGPDGSPMKAVPMDTGPTAGGVPVGSTPDGINRLTGKPFTQAPTWDQMTPDQQAAVTARQQQQAADAAQGTQNAKDYWANKNPNTRGLKESFSESIYVDKQATLRMWLEQEAQGLAVSGLALKSTVKEGIMDSIKGMFGGKKGAEAPAAGSGVTADALNKAWTAAGSPTDSEEVAKVLQGAGVPAEAVTKIFTDLKLPAPTGKVEPTLDPAQQDATDQVAQQPSADTSAPAGEKPADATSTPPDELDDIKKNAGISTNAPATPASTDATATPPDATAAVEPPPTPQAEKQSKVGVGQINKVIPTLRVRDLTSVKKTVDNTLAKRQSTKQPTAEGKYVGVYSNFLGRDI